MNDHIVLSNEAKDARAAVEHGENIHDATRNITLAALKQGKLDTERMKNVIRSVLHGASLGVDKAGSRSSLFLGEALAGVDDALSMSAEATKLAIEEASGRLQDYGKQDLQRALSDLRILEDMFLNTIKEVADLSAGVAKDTLQDLLQHARDSGTTTGKAATAAIVLLEQQIGRSLHEIASAGSHGALNTGANLAEAASGVLAGIADTLYAEADFKRNKIK